MNLTGRRTALRWLAPVLAGTLLAGAGSVVSAFTATARDSLPPRTAAQLLVDVQGAQLEGFSGTVSQTVDLGLPALPGAGRHDDANFSSLISGTHELRVWSAGPQQLRVAMIGRLGESDLVRNGSDVWTWAAADRSVTHLVLPDRAGKTDTTDKHSDGTAGTPALTPQQLADEAIAAITPSTRVSTDPTAVVAGRPAYQLVLEPRDSQSLVGSVRIAIDGATKVPTRVQVYAVGATTPALEAGFTSFDPSAPSPDAFDFTPPAGATVTERELPGKVPESGSTPDTTTTPGFGSFLTSSVATRVVGKDWSAVAVVDVPVELPAPDETNASGPLGTVASALDALPRVSGDWGTGHLLRGTLFSVLVTDDGQVAVGAVPPAVLYAALATS